jgi:hypothetical protein
MDDFLKMDVFFVVTTAVVLCVGTFVLVALFYMIRILRSVDHVAHNLSEESDRVREDLVVLRRKIAEEGMKIKHLSDFFQSVTGRAKAKRKQTPREDAS